MKQIIRSLIFILLISMASASIVAGGELEDKLLACFMNNNVRDLLDKGANVNARSNDGATVLIRYTNWCPNKVDIMQLLIERGANVNTYDKTGRTALMHAASDGREDIMRLLIANKADLNVKDNYGTTALMWAFAGFHPRANSVRLLIESGADLSIRNNTGSTALAMAEWARDTKNSGIGYDANDEKEIEEIIRLLTAAGAKR
jgi:uncharacterized protein